MRSAPVGFQLSLTIDKTGYIEGGGKEYRIEGK